MTKRAEIVFKTVVQNAKASEISAMHPNKYGLRFQKFMANQVLANKEKTRRISQSNMELYIDE